MLQVPQLWEFNGMQLDNWTIRQCGNVAMNTESGLRTGFFCSENQGIEEFCTHLNNFWYYVCVNESEHNRQQ